MQGDFSRQTFDRTKHYRNVNIQMGRVGDDADANEQHAIEEYILDTETQDIIGVCGAPKPANGGGFAISVTADGHDLTISPGRIYVGGVLCINELPATFRSQPDLPLALGSQSGLVPPTAPGMYLAYLDVWQRHITAIEDPAIREVALGGPDTCTRAKTVWQVKLLQVGKEGATVTCDTLPANWQPAAPDGRLAARTGTPPSTGGPCVLPPTAGYRRLENQLYRVEVHSGGPLAGATFKWSRDNGSVTTAIVAAANGQTLTVETTGPDDVLGFAREQWVELLDDRMELTKQAGQLLQIDAVNPATREIAIKAATPIPAFDLTAHPKLRRWDQSGTGATSNGVAMASTWLALEDGLEVQFSDNTSYRSGDWWWIPARTAINGQTGNIEWPVDTLNQPVPQAPRGIEHRYCALAIVTFNGQSFTAPVVDCRPLFPPLTAITASDVRYDNSICQLPGASTVQQAIDALCHSRQGMCTVVVSPGPTWEAVFDQIQHGQDAEICFQVGTYTLDKTIVLKGKGNLTVQGCGRGTRIIGPNISANGSSVTGPALIFDTCPSVMVRDLAVQTTTGGGRHLNGSLTFTNCPVVTVENVAIECGPAPSRRAACITVENPANQGPSALAAPDSTSVRIRHCDLVMGFQQIGILLVNVQRLQVEDNQLSTAPRPNTLNLSQLMTDAGFRASVRRLLVSSPTFVSTKPSQPPAGPAAPTLGVVEPARPAKVAATAAVISTHLALPTIPLMLNQQTIQIRTDPTLVQPWQQLIAQINPQAVQSPLALSSLVKQAAVRILVDSAFRQANPAFQAWFDTLDRTLPTMAAQGIVIGGTRATDARIVNNTISGALQGIHVGLSHREVRRGTPDQIGTLHIVGNTVEVVMTPAASRERHGIFVGNCINLVIGDNTVIVAHPASRVIQPIDGIRVWGTLGRMMIVRQNDVRAASTAIRIQPLDPPAKEQRNQWLVADNMAEAAQATVVAPPPPSVMQTNNLP